MIFLVSVVRLPRAHSPDVSGDGENRMRFVTIPLAKNNSGKAFIQSHACDATRLGVTA